MDGGNTDGSYLSESSPPITAQREGTHAHLKQTRGHQNVPKDAWGQLDTAPLRSLSPPSPTHQIPPSTYRLNHGAREPSVGGRGMLASDPSSTA